MLVGAAGRRTVRCLIPWKIILKMVGAGGRIFAMYSRLSSGSSSPSSSWAQDVVVYGSFNKVVLALNGTAGRRGSVDTSS